LDSSPEQSLPTIDFASKRNPPSTAKWYPDDWDEISKMLSNGTNRETIAGDYGVTLEELDAFIEENQDLGEAHGPAMTGA
jgi:hypothetical protein